MVPELRQKQAAEKLCQHLVHHALVNQAQKIALYLAQDGEIDLTPTLTQLWKSNKQCYLPIVQADDKLLKFARYTPDTQLKPNHFAILEPADRDTLDIADMEVVLVPLVAFDHYGHRLGRGGGYYDFSFAARKSAHKPFAMGCAYAFQQQPPLPADSWDIKLDAVATEQGLIEFAKC